MNNVQEKFLFLIFINFYSNLFFHIHFHWKTNEYTFYDFHFPFYTLGFSRKGMYPYC